MFMAFIMVVLTGCEPAPEHRNIKAEGGVIDLRSVSFIGPHTVSLFGEWEFYYNDFLFPLDFDTGKVPAPEFIQVPSFWNGQVINGRELSNHAFVTYRLRILIGDSDQLMGLKIGDMSSAYRMWVNGKPIAHNGRVGKNASEEEGQWLPVIAFTHMHPGENEIVIHVSNFSHRSGGTWSELEIGGAGAIHTKKVWLSVFDGLLIGGLLLMAIYHFGLFWMRRSDVPSLLFCLFCVSVAIRVGLTSERIFVSIIPFPDFAWQVKTEYIDTYFCCSMFYQFLVTLFDTNKRRRVHMVFHWSMAAMAIFTLLAPTTLSSYVPLPFQAVMFIGAIISFVVTVKAAKRGEEGAWSSLTGLSIVVAGLIPEVLLQNGMISIPQVSSIFVMAFGSFFFLIFQSFVLSKRFTSAYYSVRRLSRDLLATNKAVSRFVPTGFLDQLKKSSLTDIQLGDQVQREMTILFSDIRDFTSLSEKMTPADTFSFINSYLRRMSPVIHAHEGLVDKYIGDGIMALFPRSPSDAVKAAIEMERAVETYNETRIARGFVPIRCGIGIHYGTLMLGIIGDETRMEGTVIADAVNLASRLEQLTKTYQVGIVISQSVFDLINGGTEPFRCRLLDRVQVKGKKEFVTVYQVYDALPASQVDALDAAKEEFIRAVNLFHTENIPQAAEIFSALGAQLPWDYACHLYIMKCKARESKE